MYIDGETVETIDDILRIGCENPYHWFRGHPKIYETLVPRVFRQDYVEAWNLDQAIRDPESGDFGGYPEKRPSWGGFKRHEAELIEDFVKAAPATGASTLPAPQDRLSWLVLMQHHGLPTRLLDWTESVLVALYFVVTEAAGEDGELWRFDPQLHYGDELGFDGLPWTAELERQPIVVDAWLPYQERTQHGVLDPLFPPLRFQRMMAQRSVFTIHAPPHEHGEGDDRECDAGCSYGGYCWGIYQPERFVIPAAKKARLKIDLRCLCIDRKSLFPDLDNLSRALLEDGYRPIRRHWRDPNAVRETEPMAE